MQESKLHTVVTYALNAAITSNNHEMIKDCIECEATITVPMMMKYVQSNYPPNDETSDKYRKDPTFALLIDKLPVDVLFGRDMIDQCAYNGNSYYLETVLSTRRYHHNYDLDSKILANFANASFTPQLSIDLLVKYGFMISPSIFSNFKHFALSRIIATGIDLTGYQPLIFKFIISLYQEDRTMKLGSRGCKYTTSDVHATLQALMNYLRSNPHAVSHYMITKYVIRRIIHRFTNVSDVSKYIGKCYLRYTVKFYSYCIIQYQQILDTLG